MGQREYIMTRSEFAVLVKALRTYYPRQLLLPNEEALTLWYDQLLDLDYKATAAGLKKWVAKERWSPSIADIRAMSEKEVRNREIDVIFLRHRFMIKQDIEKGIEEKGGADND